MKIKIPRYHAYDFFLTARYLYYCENCTIMSDQEYDHLEKEYEIELGQLPVGSDNKEDYPPHIRALGLYFKLSNQTKK